LRASLYLSRFVLGIRRFSTEPDDGVREQSANDNENGERDKQHKYRYAVCFRPIQRHSFANIPSAGNPLAGRRCLETIGHAGSFSIGFSICPIASLGGHQAVAIEKCSAVAGIGSGGAAE
jgi:hypothetical protein